MTEQWRIQDFPEERAPTPQPTILPYFPENCMKLKEFESGGGGASLAPPLDQPLQKRMCNKEIDSQICISILGYAQGRLTIEHQLLFYIVTSNTIAGLYLQKSETE